MTLDYSPLEKAIATLFEAMDEYQRNSTDFIWDACIQRFEYTYDLSHKMLKRYLEQVSANPLEIDKMSFQNLIRTDAEKGGLLSSYDIWAGYREARNSTSHGYDENKAAEVFKQFPAFLNETKTLLANLKQQDL